MKCFRKPVSFPACNHVQCLSEVIADDSSPPYLAQMAGYLLVLIIIMKGQTNRELTVTFAWQLLALISTL